MEYYQVEIRIIKDPDRRVCALPDETDLYKERTTMIDRKSLLNAMNLRPCDLKPGFQQEMPGVVCKDHNGKVTGTFDIRILTTEEARKRRPGVKVPHRIMIMCRCGKEIPFSRWHKHKCYGGKMRIGLSEDLSIVLYNANTEVRRLDLLTCESWEAVASSLESLKNEISDYLHPYEAEMLEKHQFFGYPFDPVVYSVTERLWNEYMGF